MAIERSWEAVSPIAFTATGGADGTITLSSVAGFKVKQSVTVSATALPTLKLEVKKVLSPTKLIVGPVVTTGKLLARQDLSAYNTGNNATIRAEEQKKAVLPIADIIQAVYRQEPGTTIGVEIDDQFGNPIDSVKDSNGVNRLAVDGQFHAEVDVQVDVQLTAKDDDPKPGDVHDSVRIGDGDDEMEVNPDGSINVKVVSASGNSLSYAYNEVLAVPLAVETTILSVPIAPSAQKQFQRVEVSGTNVAEIRLKVNSTIISKRRLWHGQFNTVFEFEVFNNGFLLVSGDVLDITVIHNRPDDGDFSATAWYL